MTSIVNFFELSLAFDLAPAEALAFFRAKGLKPTFSWMDMLGDEHDVAFTVAKMMDVDLLKTVKEKLDAALAEGKTLADFRKELVPTLQAAGWWGKADLVDPLTGKVVKAQLGSASRLETIFRTNLQSAYAAGQWEQIEANADVAPFLLYDAVDDDRTRPAHAAMDGTLLPVTDPWWKSHFPPNGWNCRCGVVQLSADELAEYGVKVNGPPPAKLVEWKNPRTGHTHLIPEDLDPGWDHNPGLTRMQQIKTLAAEKAAALEAAAQAAIAEANAQGALVKAQYQAELAAAQEEIDAHIAAQTPYLASAIKKIQAQKGGAALNPKELLASAQEKAAKKSKLMLVGDYKAAMIAGKAPSAKAQAAFDALTEAEQAKVVAAIEEKSGAAAAKAKLVDLVFGKGDPYEVAAFGQIANDPAYLSGSALQKLALVTAKAEANATDDLVAMLQANPPGTPAGDVIKAAYNADPAAPKIVKVKAAKDALAAHKAAEETVAAAELLKILAGQHSPAPALKKSILAKITASAEAQSLTAPELLKQVLDTAAAKLDQKASAHLVYVYKQKAIKGKIPKPEEVAAFEALSEAKKAKVLDEIAAAKAKAATPEPAALAPTALPPEVLAFDAMTPAKQAEALAKLDAKLSSNWNGVPLYMQNKVSLIKAQGTAAKKAEKVNEWIEQLATGTGYSPDAVKYAATGVDKIGASHTAVSVAMEQAEDVVSNWDWAGTISGPSSSVAEFDALSSFDKLNLIAKLEAKLYGYNEPNSDIWHKAHAVMAGPDPEEGIKDWLSEIGAVTGHGKKTLKLAALKVDSLSPTTAMDELDAILNSQVAEAAAPKVLAVADLPDHLKEIVIKGETPLASQYLTAKAAFKYNNFGTSLSPSELAEIDPAIFGDAKKMQAKIDALKADLAADEFPIDQLLALAAGEPVPVGSIAPAQLLSHDEQYKALIEALYPPMIAKEKLAWWKDAPITGKLDLLEEAKSYTATWVKTENEILTEYALKNLPESLTGGAAALPPPLPIDVLLPEAEALSVKYEALLKALGDDGGSLTDALDDFNAQSIAVKKSYLKELENSAQGDYGMTAAQIAKVYEKVTPPPPSQATPPPPPIPPSQVIPEPLSMANMTKTGAQAGSNTGGFYQDVTTGTRYYIKQPKTDDIGRNEWLASKLYEAAGVEVPKLTLWKENGTTYLASEIIDGITENKALLTSGLEASMPGGLDTYIVDAWLGNWDVVGVDLTNLVFIGNRALRVDVGGALRYRAMGGLKGSAWNDAVADIETIRDPKFNTQGARAFANISRDDMISGARKVLAVTDRKIDELVNAYGPTVAAEREALKATLKARRERIRELFPEADVKAPAAELPQTIDVTPAELDAIKAARINGYTRIGDADKIEDHNVRIHQYIDASNVVRTRVTLKIRDTDHLRGILKSAARVDDGRQSVSLLQTGEPIQKIVKNLAYQVQHAQPFTLLNKQRLDGAIAAIDAALADIEKVGSTLGWPGETAALAAEKVATLQKIRLELDWMRSQWVEGGSVPAWRVTIPFGDVDGLLISNPANSAPRAAGLSFARNDNPQYALASFSRSHQKMTNRKAGYHYAVAFEAEKDGVSVRVFGPESGMYIRGQVELDVKGGTAEAATKALAVLRDDLGIDTAPTTEADRLEVWLDQTAWHRLQLNPRGTRASKYAPYKALGAITDQQERIEKKFALLNADVGYDLTKTPTFNAREGAQAFGHGRRYLLRADYDNDVEYRKWADKHLLYHSVGTLSKSGIDEYGAWKKYMVPVLDGGGTLTSLLDRTRRGLSVTSQADSKDFTHGGAAYVFTRIKEIGARGRWTDNDIGFYWKPHNHMKRLDRSSRTTDHYGDVTTVEPHRTDRIDTPEQFASAAQNYNDETIFKDGLSLFDDLDHITVYNEAERAEAIDWLQQHGYHQWPDGRPLNEVIRAKYR